jgi:chemotaxis protein MotB
MLSLHPVFKLTSSSNCAVMVFFTALLVGCASTPPGQTESDRLLANCQISLTTSRLQRDTCESDLADVRDAMQAQRTEADTQMAVCLTERELLEENLSGTELELSRCRKSGAIANENLARLKQREKEIRRSLEEEIEARDVEVQLLMGQLSVRVLDKILFKSGSADILATGYKVLEKIGDALRDGDDTIRIEGHTDNMPIGPNLKNLYPSNWELAAMRAASVIRYLQFGHGIDPARLVLVSLSKYRPVAGNDSDRGRQRNRRVEIVLRAAEQF